MRHILSAKQFEPAELGELFTQANMMDQQRQDTDLRRELARTHTGRLVATLFYEPSTRTRLSFEAAAQALGAGVLSTENARTFSSAVKGESIEDTVRTIAGYADVAVIRHDETGALDKAAEAADGKISVINAGDGAGEHPTQSLLDLYTIFESQGRVDHLNVVIGGDLVKGRTARSLALLLSKYEGNHITFVSLPELAIGDDIKEQLTLAGMPFSETDEMDEALGGADVIYWTRLQLERHGSDSAVAATQGRFVIDESKLKIIKPSAVIMHPLPRNGEISREVDVDHRAGYFRQAENGLYVRMALLDQILKDQA